MTPRRGSAVARVLTALLCYSLLSLPPIPSAFAQISKGIVGGDGVTTRSGPGVEFDRVGRLQTGDDVMVLEESGKWLRVLDPKGSEVWVFAKWVDQIPLEPEVEEVTPGELAPVQISPAAVDSLDQAAIEESLAVAPPPLIDKKERNVPWLWIGAGATVAGVVGLLALSGEEKKDDEGSLSFYIEFP